MSIRTIQDGLVRVTGTASLFCGLWSRGKARKSAVCHLSGQPIAVGDLIYRPVTNNIERQRRVRADVMEKSAAATDKLFSRRATEA